MPPLFYAPPTEIDGIRQNYTCIIKTVSIRLKLTAMVQRKGPPMCHQMNKRRKTTILERMKTMITKMQFMNGLVGKPVVDAMVKTLYNQSDDFPAIYQAYLDAIEKLHAVLGPEAKHEICKYITAVEQICASNIYYAGTQGLKMNYDHFINPMTPNCTWPQVDYDDYLRPHMADLLPLYETASRFIRKFEEQLPDELDEVVEAISAFEVAMECSGMKLAHYYGYLMGNELLHHCIPGYHPDSVLDIKYTHIVEKYFGKMVSMDQWEGCIFVKDWKIAPIPEEDTQDTIVLREEIWNDAVI